ncbi:hypothetical protein KJ925_04830 [Patescibacteria group bacterium]|nr:hypothetical protein [Patescibacteria group bacterium]
MTTIGSKDNERGLGQPLTGEERAHNRVLATTRELGQCIIRTLALDGVKVSPEQAWNLASQIVSAWPEYQRLLAGDE